jgi:hypothetical protein
LPREKNISESAVLLVFLFCREAVAVASEDWVASCPHAFELYQGSNANSSLGRIARRRSGWAQNMGTWCPTCPNLNSPPSWISTGWSE